MLSVRLNTKIDIIHKYMNTQFNSMCNFKDNFYGSAPVVLQISVCSDHTSVDLKKEQVNRSSLFSRKLYRSVGVILDRIVGFRVLSFNFKASHRLQGKAFVFRRTNSG